MERYYLTYALLNSVFGWHVFNKIRETYGSNLYERNNNTGGCLWNNYKLSNMSTDEIKELHKNITIWKSEEEEIFCCIYKNEYREPATPMITSRI